jgi:hypothetical protein
LQHVPEPDELFVAWLSDKIALDMQDGALAKQVLHEAKKT